MLRDERSQCKTNTHLVSCRHSMSHWTTSSASLSLLYSACHVYLFALFDRYRASGLWTSTCCKKHLHPTLRKVPDLETAADECGIDGIQDHVRGSGTLWAIFASKIPIAKLDFVQQHRAIVNAGWDNAIILQITYIYRLCQLSSLLNGYRASLVNAPVLQRVGYLISCM